ncbi:MAG: S9 family peptidase [Nocardioidaceae bacterium]
MTETPPPVEAPYGSWHSPVTAASLTSGTVGLSEPRIDGADSYWLESRASEGGRVTVVRRTHDGEPQDVTSAPFNVRSRVHEYGGGAYDVAGGVLVFCSFDDRRVYRVDLGPQGPTDPRPITPAGDLRYGDLRLDRSRNAVFAVCEDHGSEGPEPANRLVRLDLDGSNDDGGTVLVDGHDFVSSPAPSPDGRWFAWIQWDHPNMPWDGSELCVAEMLSDGRLSGTRVVAGGPRESVSQPGWAPDGRLVLVCDRTGWWNLYAANVADVADLDQGLVALWSGDNEFAGAQWGLGMSSYGISASGALLCSWLDEGYARLAMLDLGSGARTPLDSDVTEVTAVDAVCVAGEQALLTVGYADRPATLVRIDLTAPADVAVVRSSATTQLDPELVSRCEPVTWRGHGGDDVHGFYLPPRNPAFTAPDGELPPLLVMSHGGPTGMTRPAFDLRLQYWTTRGFAVLDVNYGGSSGYGRAYRERLRDRWGEVDVDDCTLGALQMAETGRADPHRLAIRGGSAGGYTTLAALTFRDVFHAGASLYGVGDLEALARETHKFESRYLDGLVGPYPEARETYLERSPVHHVDQLRCPLILLQGSEDRVVPPNQAETMAAALRTRGLPVALLMFEGEGHGFRKAESVIRATEAEAYFYARVFGFELADAVEPVEIENLPAPG